MEGYQDVDILIDAFDTFKRASQTLESYYRGLEERVKDLNLELAEKNNYLSGILEGLPVGIIVTDSDGVIETVNSTACLILEKDMESLVGERMPFDEMGCGGGFEKGKGSVEIFRMDGRGLAVDGEICIRGRNGRKKTVSITSTGLKNLQGVDRGRLIVLKDVSEVKRLRESLERDRRLKAMGEMAASLAHQIRNPLGSIELFASILSDELSHDEERQRLAKEIIHGVKELNNTLSNMLLFVHDSKPYKDMVKARELFEETIETMGFILQDREISIETSEVPDSLILYIDKELFKQALLNIIMNSVEAIGNDPDGRISISLKVESDGIHITISDNGSGIGEEEIERIFDPFFTTKPRGTGLGLSVVNNIIKAHGGMIEVESIEGKGTTFDIIIQEVNSYAEDTCDRR